MTRKKESFWRSSNPSRKLLPNWFSEICSAFIYAFRELSLLLDCVIFRRKKIPLLPLPVILGIFCKSSSAAILAMIVEKNAAISWLSTFRAAKIATSKPFHAFVDPLSTPYHISFQEMKSPIVTSRMVLKSENVLCSRTIGSSGDIIVRRKATWKSHLIIPHPVPNLSLSQTDQRGKQGGAAQGIFWKLFYMVYRFESARHLACYGKRVARLTYAWWSAFRRAFSEPVFFFSKIGLWWNIVRFRIYPFLSILYTLYPQRDIWDQTGRFAHSSLWSISLHPLPVCQFTCQKDVEAIMLKLMWVQLTLLHYLVLSANELLPVRILELVKYFGLATLLLPLEIRIGATDGCCKMLILNSSSLGLIRAVTERSLGVFEHIGQRGLLIRVSRSPGRL